MERVIPGGGGGEGVPRVRSWRGAGPAGWATGNPSGGTEVSAAIGRECWERRSPSASGDARLTLSTCSLVCFLIPLYFAARPGTSVPGRST